VQEFFTSGTFTVPPNITHVMVEMWGGGGGGGSANVDAGSGGAGAYTRDVVSVTSGAVYNVIVGAGGAAGSIANSGYGGNGGDSQFATTFASGGQGGTPCVSLGSSGYCNEYPTSAGGNANPNAMISHPGGSSYGTFGGVPWNPPFAYFLANMSIPTFGVNYAVNTASGLGIGFGGGGARTGPPTYSAIPGLPGYVLLTW
jgi:hypothetical protein